MKGKDSGAKQGIIKRVILVKEVEEEYEKLKNSLMMKKKLSSKPLKKKVWNFTVKSKLFKRALIGGLINPHISVSICKYSILCTKERSNGEMPELLKNMSMARQ